MMKGHKFWILIVHWLRNIKRYALNTVFMLLVASYSVCAQSLWTNSEEGFAARFPTNPSKVEAAASAGSGYAYQSIKQFDSGRALYAVTVVSPIPNNLQFQKLKNYIEESNKEFIKSMGQNPKKVQKNWTEFGDGRPQLNYNFNLLYQEAKLRAKGFWIRDKNRLFRVSVTYTGEFSDQEIINITEFLDTFMFLNN